MHQFRYVRGKLYCENVAVESLVKKFGSPIYIYSQKTLEDHFQKLDKALAPIDHLICYAMKANSNMAVMRTLANCGSGFDVVSGGELQRAIAAGGDPKKCVFAGVGKTEPEIEFALRKGIYSFNVESEAEINRINKVAARLKKVAPIAVRVNPNVDAGTHAHITTGTYENKFGIQFEHVEAVYARASKLKNIRLRGIQMHIGSQLTEVAPYEAAVKKVLPMVQKLAEKYKFEFFSIGGGIGIIYNPALASGSPEWWQSDKAKELITPEKYAAKLLPLLQPLGLRILLEPGRFIVGNAAILVTRVEYLKKTGKKNFVIVDAAMTDLIRPCLYESYHEIVPTTEKKGALISSDVVGGVCESTDFFAKDRPLPKVGEGDYLALLSAGAYGFVMASTYNTRPLIAEVLVNGNKAAVVRTRQKMTDIWKEESIPAWLSAKK